jgi:DNA repair protein RecO (recombination protein O)
MKLYTSDGIIFRTVKYSETSIICDIYTREKGLRSFIVSGVRSNKAGSKAAIYRPLNIVEFVSYDNEHDNLARIKEIYLKHHFQQINIDVIRSSVAIFMLEVCRNAIKEKEANDELYHFVEEWLLYIDVKSNYHPCLHLMFMIELSVYLGFGPLENFSPENLYFDLLDGTFCNYSNNSEYLLDADDSLALFELVRRDRNLIHDLHLQKTARIQLTENLIKYYKIHISGFRELNSFEILKNVL